MLRNITHPITKRIQFSFTHLKRRIAAHAQVQRHIVIVHGVVDRIHAVLRHAFAFRNGRVQMLGVVKHKGVQMLQHTLVRQPMHCRRRLLLMMLVQSMLYCQAMQRLVAQRLGRRQIDHLAAVHQPIADGGGGAVAVVVMVRWCRCGWWVGQHHGGRVRIRRMRRRRRRRHHPERFHHILERGQMRRVLERLDVLAQRRRIRVALIAAGHLAHVRLLRRVRARVLEPIRRIGVGLLAAGHRTHVRLLARMRSRVDLQVLGARERLVALLAAMRLLFGVRAHVHQHLVASVEAALGAGAVMPLAVVEAGRTGDGVRVRDVRGELLERGEMPVGV